MRNTTNWNKQQKTHSSRDTYVLLRKIVKQFYEKHINVKKIMKIIDVKKNFNVKKRSIERILEKKWKENRILEKKNQKKIEFW